MNKPSATDLALGQIKPWHFYFKYVFADSQAAIKTLSNRKINSKLVKGCFDIPQCGIKEKEIGDELTREGISPVFGSRNHFADFFDT